MAERGPIEGSSVPQIAAATAGSLC